MNLLCKTPQGTIGAFHFTAPYEDVPLVKGIACGINGKGNFLSLEYDKEKGKLQLLLNRELMEKQGFELIFVDDKWNELEGK